MYYWKFERASKVVLENLMTNVATEKINSFKYLMKFNHTILTLQYSEKSERKVKEMKWEENTFTLLLQRLNEWKRARTKTYQYQLGWNISRTLKTGML